jgi:3-(3-hydroxy-phenyl)propionate hydroxylase
VSDQFDADVLVVGCGPVGVMAALRCAQRGLRVLAIDRSIEVYPLPRAIGMDDEIQELMARAGLIDELRTYSKPIPGGEFTDGDGNRIVGIELPDGTVGALGHPPIIAFDQPSLERSLRRAAVDAGVDMRLGLDAYAIADLGPAAGDGVRVQVGDDDRESAITARWLIAADGAKSTIRSLRGISMIDQGFDQTWLVVDTTLLDPDIGLPRVARQQCGADRVCTLVPGPGRHRRWEFQLRSDEHRDEVLKPDAIAEFLAPWGTPEELQVDRAAVYRFHATVAETFRDGPVFLAGDSAHQMPPFNGQGMCTGMRDVENLSWKLAAVAHGQCAVGLLDTYDEERRPHATEQVAHSVDSGLLMQAIAHDGDTALETGYGQRPFPKLTGSMFVDDHPLVGTVLPEFVDSLFSTSEGWRVLSCDVDQALRLWAELDATVVNVTADDVPGLLESGGALVVRPDRYVAAVSNDAVLAAQQITSALHLASSSASTGRTTLT